MPTIGRRYTVRDTGIPYLQCRVSATGKRTLQICRRPEGQVNPVRVKIQSTESMKHIQAEAHAINVELSAGINPNEREKREAVLKTTLQEAFDQYIAMKNLAPATLASYQKAMERMNDWRDEPIQNIKKLMVLELYNDLEEDSHSAAMKMPQVLRAVWNFTNDLSDNDDLGIPPTVILNKQKKQWSRTNVRNRKIPIDKLPVWLEAVRALPSQKGDGKRMAAYLEFLLLTGLRRREAGYLRWEDVNMKVGYFIVRDTKNHSDHCLPITKRARQLLHSMRNNGSLVFGVEEPKKAIKRVEAVCDIKFSCHDLRRTFATLADQSGAGSYVIKAILNHAPSNDVTGAHYAGYSPLDSSGNVSQEEIQVIGESLQIIENYILLKANLIKNVELQVVS